MVPIGGKGAGDTGHKFVMMKWLLSGKTEGGAEIKREASVKRQVRQKSQSLRDLRFLFNLGDVFFFTRISVGSFGLDIALYIVLRGQAPDADNRGFLGFGIETCAVLSECPFERLINDAVLGCYLGGRFAGELSPYLARFDDGRSEEHTSELQSLM